MVRVVKNKSELDEIRKDAGDKLLVIDFYAQWCGPCKQISPKIEELSKAMSEVIFLKVDVDESEELAVDFNISAMPTFVFIKSGEEKARFSGANIDKVKGLIQEHK